MAKMVETYSFPNIRLKIDRLLKITNDYLFDDLVKAVYCINLCINNRSVLESCLALNACLIEYEEHGSQKIETYGDFKIFFNKIYGILKPSVTDDYTVEDFGEVRFRYNSKFYRVITGTGHNNVFACLNFLPILARETSHEEELTLSLDYSSGIIDFFIEDNKNDGAEEIRFVLPSEKLFEKVKFFFDEEYKKYDLFKLYHMMKSDEATIEKCHFVMKKETIYPLYNASLLIDLYDIWEKEINRSQRISVANIGIIERVYSLFQTDRSNRCHMFAPAMIFPNQKFDPTQHQYTFIAMSSHGVIIAINADEYNEDQLEKEIQNIQSYHRNNKLHIAETINPFDKKGLRGLHIPAEAPIEFLIYTSTTNLNQISMLLGIRTEQRITVTALDVIYYLNFMDSIDELFGYLSCQKERDFDSSFGFGSDAALFFTWKNHGRYIAKGAIVYGLLSIWHDTENEFVVDYFRNELKDYPFDVEDDLFKEPFAWKIKKINSTEYEYTMKYGIGFGGRYFTLPRKNHIFLTHNVEFYKDGENFGEYRRWIHLIEEIIIEGFSSIKSVFEENRTFSNTGIQLFFLPFEYAIRAGNAVFLQEDRTYVYSDAQYYKQKWIIRFVLKDIERIFNDIQNAENRSTELKIFSEILLPLLQRIPDFNSLFESEIQLLSQNKKKVDVFSAEIMYKWDDNVQDFAPEDHSYHEVRKRIANVCYENTIEPGNYHGLEANRIIRNMQKAIIKDFEREVSKYQWCKLHNVLLDYHSTLLHDIYINWRRFGSHSGLDEDKDLEVKNRIIAQREKAKLDDRNVLYLIETNLFLHSKVDKLPTRDNINFLLAYSNWLVILNDVADMCYFADDEAYIEITHEYVVDTFFDKHDEHEVNDLNHRVYSYSEGLRRNKDVDKKHFDKVKEAFKEDLGFDFQCFLDVLSYCSSSFSEIYANKNGSNVYQVPLETLISDFMEDDSHSHRLGDVTSIFDYLILPTQELKTVNGKEDFYLPIGKRRTREFRFELKPLVSIGEDVIFSPITTDQLGKNWINGFFDFILPVEAGMNKTKQSIIEWKRFYERNIVYDIEKLFVQNHYDIVKTNFELNKLNNSHPQWLGDYDVFAVDIKNKNVWIVECKVIEKVATFYDMYRQQNRFFHEAKEDEKFSRRIRYLQQHTDQVMLELGCVDCEGFKVIPYMCMNKILISRYKNIEFPIVSYSEFKTIVRKNIENVDLSEP